MVPGISITVYELISGKPIHPPTKSDGSSVTFHDKYLWDRVKKQIIEAKIKNLELSDEG